MSPNFLGSSVQCTSWSVWNALALGGEEVIANNIWALKLELSKTEQESYFHFTCSFFSPSRRWIISNHILFSSSELDPKRARSFQTAGEFAAPSNDYLMHLCHLLSLLCENTLRKCVSALNCSQLFYSPFSMLVPSLGIDIIMHLSKIDCHFRASIMCKNWQQILPLGFAYILCMLLYFFGIQ